MRYRVLILLNLFILFCSIPLISKADGGIFPPPYYWIHETGQRAVIFYENGVETLVLTTDFRGKASEFGWVIPTPNKPEVTKGSDEIFTSLNEIIRKTSKKPRSLLFDAYSSKEEFGKEVVVIETKKIDYYDIAVLSAQNPHALVNWLNENGYIYPEEESYILNDYIDNNWYFTAIKISKEAQSSQNVKEELKEGHMNPIKLVFKSSSIIYPLRISSIGERYRTPRIMPIVEDKGLEKEAEFQGKHKVYPRRFSIPIHLYIIADHKKEIPGFTIKYGNWISKKVIRNLAYDTNGNPLINPSKSSYYLTYLHRYMDFSDMTYDLIIRDAADNKRVNAENPLVNLFYGIIIVIGLMFVWLFSPLGIMFVLGLIIDIGIKAKAGKIIAKALQFFAMSITLLLEIIYLVWIFMLSSKEVSVFSKSIAIGLGVVILISIVVYIIQKRHLKDIKLG